ncbi:MAG TPA: carbamoyl-phosphate synthase small subunit [Candidatus Saccharimonadales bacterium]|nr:carbamoyl-phosphate synthase small subunit [Candidatus Saccharimonadales bacterium]
MAKLILKNGEEFEGVTFGYEGSVGGEVVFATGMTGYPEALTDPSFAGQILILTYPLIGNYGVPKKKFWESGKLQISGLIVSDYIDTPSHHQSKMTLSEWLKKEKIPALEIKDTRYITQYLRENGTMLGKIINGKDTPFFDPNVLNIVEQVSIKKILKEKPEGLNKHKRVIIIDCGAKNNIKRCFLKRGVETITVPWDFDPFSNEGQKQLKNVIANEVKQSLSIKIAASPLAPRDDNLFDALFISNGPGDPKKADKTIEVIKKSLENKIPTLGICLGNQLLALAAGGDTYKLKYGHRSQNQPCIMEKSNRCFITTQNHGFAISDVPVGFDKWFTNANDDSIEGIIHSKLPFMSVQFHPEATPGPKDTEWIFDFFLEKLT